MLISTNCPRCNRAFDVPVRFEGRAVRCCDCKTDFTIPAATAWPAADEPVAANPVMVPVIPTTDDPATAEYLAATRNFRPPPPDEPVPPILPSPWRFRLPEATLPVLAILAVIVSISVAIPKLRRMVLDAPGTPRPIDRSPSRDDFRDRFLDALTSKTDSAPTPVAPENFTRTETHGNLEISVDIAREVDQPADIGRRIIAEYARQFASVPPKLLDAPPYTLRYSLRVDRTTEAILAPDPNAEPVHVRGIRHLVASVTFTDAAGRPLLYQPRFFSTFMGSAHITVREINRERALTYVEITPLLPAAKPLSFVWGVDDADANPDRILIDLRLPGLPHRHMEVYNDARYPIHSMLKRNKLQSTSAAPLRVAVTIQSRGDSTAQLAGSTVTYPLLNLSVEVSDPRTGRVVGIAGGPAPALAKELSTIDFNDNDLPPADAAIRTAWRSAIRSIDYLELNRSAGG